MTAVKRIFRYIQGTHELGLLLHRSANPREIVLRLYGDSDFAGEPEENEKPLRSLTGILAFIFGVGVIYAVSSLQGCQSKSTCEAEYKTTGTAAKIAFGFRQFLEELGLPQEDPTVIYCDNQASIAVAHSNLSNVRSRAIKIDFHFVRQEIKEGRVAVKYCPTELIVADILTKALAAGQYKILRDILLGRCSPVGSVEYQPPNGLVLSADVDPISVLTSTLKLRSESAMTLLFYLACFFRN